MFPIPGISIDRSPHHITVQVLHLGLQGPQIIKVITRMIICVANTNTKISITKRNDHQHDYYITLKAIQRIGLERMAFSGGLARFCSLCHPRFCFSSWKLWSFSCSSRRSFSSLGSFISSVLNHSSGTDCRSGSWGFREFKIKQWAVSCSNVSSFLCHCHWGRSSP